MPLRLPLGRACHLCLLWLMLVPFGLAELPTSVEVEPAKTSIYVGTVTLKVSRLTRSADRFEGTYEAKVFPFFFSSEQGTLHVDCTDEQLHALLRGETVPFTGGGSSSSGEPRRVEGKVVPDGPDAKTGKIKVRIFVSKKIQVVFNTTYRLAS